MIFYSEITDKVNDSTAKLIKMSLLGFFTLFGTYFVYVLFIKGALLNSIVTAQSPFLINSAAIITIAYTLFQILNKLFVYYKLNIFSPKQENKDNTK